MSDDGYNFRYEVPGPLISSEEIQRIVHETLTDGVAAFKRRCAIRAGVREASELAPGCNHIDHWDFRMQACARCGTTARELYCRRPPQP